MLFSEVYGSYFGVVAAILAEAADGTLTERGMTQLVHEKAFGESGLSIPQALKSGAWPLLDQELGAVLKHTPTMPMTMLQKRWLKSLLQDPRIALFAPDATGLEEVEPLYDPETFVYVDRYDDGDPYDDPRYIENFRTILQAIREKRMIRVRFHGYTGYRHSVICMPYRLEYSAKDDKFRLLAMKKWIPYTVNMARVYSCDLKEEYPAEALPTPKEHTEELTILLHNERNALERALLHFSHFEKETRKLEDGSYQIKLRYDHEDETELLIRVLSFGPVMEVVEPAAFRHLLRERLMKQGALWH